MSSPLAWVVGAGGLLGSSVLRALGENAFRSDVAFAWTDAEKFSRQLHEAVSAFAQRLQAEPGRPWGVAWCAGAGVVATSAAAMEAETKSFRLFLQYLSADPNLRSRTGNVLLTGSAGGVHGGNFACPITELTAPMPASAYGRAKLEQEQILVEWARAQPRPINTLVARISNLYGPAQRLDKPQGLISHLSRSLIHGAPVHIYVSLDTIRDYLFVDDAGRRLAGGLWRLAREAPLDGLQLTKLYASEREVSIAGILGVFRAVARRRLRVVSGLHASAALQPRRLQFRSTVWPRDVGRQVELIEGISRVYQHQLALFRQGRLPAPPVAHKR